MGISWDDATWILTSSFIIFTMQTGFSLLNSGCVNKKSEVSMMMKVLVDPLFNGLAYWSLAYGVSVSFSEQSSGNNTLTESPFFTFGDFLVDSLSHSMGQLFASFTFRLSLSAVATTIVSGAMAERITFKAYCCFVFLSTIFFALPCYWIWAEAGFLLQMKAVDIAGCSTLHLVGGVSGLVATIYLKPRTGRFSSSAGMATDGPAQTDTQNLFSKTLLHSPTNALLGAFMLWWGWLGLNMGSTFGVSGHKWKYASRASVATIIASGAGGTNALIISYFTRKRKLDIIVFIVGLLSSLVAISGGCTLYQPWEALVVGWVGSSLGILTIPVLSRLGIDDPTNTVAIHFPASIWGMVIVSLIVEKDSLLELTYNQSGLLRGGSISFLVAQCVAVLSIGTWTAIMTFAILTVVSKITPIRLTLAQEKEGADMIEHNIDYKSNDDSLLPQSRTTMLSLGLNPDAEPSLDPISFAKKRLKRVVHSMRANSMFRGMVNENVLKMIKEQQVKNLAISWPVSNLDNQNMTNENVVYPL